MEKTQEIKNFFKTYCAYMSRFVVATLEIQLFLSCMYIPILSYWGLAWPLLSIISTPLFIPLFIVFLIVSALIFFNALFLQTIFPFFIAILEGVTATWLLILSMPPFEYRLGFCLPPVAVLFLLPCCALYIISLSHRREYKVLYLSASIFLFYGITVLIGLTKPSCQVVQTDRGFFHLIHCNGKNIIVDSGRWAKAVPHPSWFLYTLMPEITKLSGTTGIDIWIILSVKKNFSRCLGALSMISPHACMVTNEKNYAQLNPADYSIAIDIIKDHFFINQIEFLVDKHSITILFQKRIVFKTIVI